MANIPEYVEQIKVVHWIRSKTNLKVIHIANEGKRSHVQGSLMKRMGLTKGVADLFLPQRCGEYSGMWIEMKSSSGKLSLEQSSFLKEMTELGYLAVACWGSESAINIIQEAYDLKFDNNHQQ